VGGGLDSTLKSTALFPVRSRPDLKSKIMNHKLRDKNKKVKLFWFGEKTKVSKEKTFYLFPFPTGFSNDHQ
jgi:hypothetical protein